MVIDMSGVYKMTMVSMCLTLTNLGIKDSLAAKYRNIFYLYRMSKNWTYENPKYVTGVFVINRVRLKT